MIEQCGAALWPMPTVIAAEVADGRGLVADLGAVSLELAAGFPAGCRSCTGLDAPLACSSRNPHSSPLASPASRIGLGCRFQTQTQTQTKHRTPAPHPCAHMPPTPGTGDGSPPPTLRRRRRRAGVRPAHGPPAPPGPREPVPAVGPTPPAWLQTPRPARHRSAPAARRHQDRSPGRGRQGAGARLRRGWGVWCVAS